MKKILTVAFVLLLASSLLGASAFAQTSTREFAPVQKGFVPSARSTDVYRPGRLIVQFRSQAMPDLHIRDAGLNKGTGLATTGIASFDRMAQPYLPREVRPLLAHEPANRTMAVGLGADRWFAVDFDAATDMEAMARQLATDPNVESASPDYRAFPAAVPNDPLYADHWGHNNTAQLPDLDWGGTYDHTLSNTVGTPGFDANAQAAWDGSQGYGSSSVVIAIIDSGVDQGHPDLNQVTGYDYGDNDSNPDDNSASPGHGTACAGVAASIANNGLGSAGIAAGCRIMPLKVADSSGSMYFSAIVNAIYHAADNGADIISMSLGAAISSDSATDAALQYAYNAGVTIFAATGNENNSTISYPAINTYVIGVGAASPCGERKRSSSSSSETNPGVYTDPNGYTCDGERWWGSNYGVNSQDAAGAVDILAPTILPTTDIQGSGGYSSGNYSNFFNGTSCATPYAAGVAALVKSANPGWTPSQIRNQIMDTAQDVTGVESGSGWDRYSGYGMIDAAAAVGGGGGPVAPVAAFAGTPTSGYATLTVNFTDQSSGSPTSWSWDFGDGGFSSAQNPSHDYTNAGTYTVSLTVTNSVGSDATTKNGYITVNDAGSLYASLPFSDGFESGALGPNWTSSEGVEGRIQVTTANGPHSGSYHLTMDDSVNGGSYSQNEAWLHVDLSGHSQVDLEFWWKDFADESHTQDGVFFSDDGGANFVKVQDLGGASYTDNVWNDFQLDVDQLASANGLNLSSTFVIKFQQYDNYSISTDGAAFDDISVTAGAAGSPPVAAFAGSPTSGAAPLAVNFTDQSTNAPTSWSWDFGDGGNSTAQNPSHTYTSAGTYTVSLTATNAYGSDGVTKANYVTVTTGGGGGTWETITSDDFESGWGSYVDGGSDCRLSSRDAAYAHQGSYCVRLRDNTNSSVFTHASSHDVTGYVELEVSFWYYARSMDNSNEDFWLQVNSGSGWQTVASWAEGIDFNNGQFYNPTVSLTPSQVNFSSNFRLRFRCDASGNSDWVYIDEVEFRGLTAGGADAGLGTFAGEPVLPKSFALEQNRPNPFNPTTNIDFALPSAEHVKIAVFDTRGRRVAMLADREFGAGIHTVRWEATRYASGVYYYTIQAGSYAQTKRMVLVK